MRQFADENNIDSSKFPKNATAVSRRLNKIRSNLREGLGIEVMIDKITSGSGNATLKNTTLIKIRTIPPLAPLAPLYENDEGNSTKIVEVFENSGGIDNKEPEIPPPETVSNDVQITSDIANSGGSGGSGANYAKRNSCNRKKSGDKKEITTFRHLDL